MKRVVGVVAALGLTAVLLVLTDPSTEDHPTQTTLLLPPTTTIRTTPSTTTPRPSTTTTVDDGFEVGPNRAASGFLPDGTEFYVHADFPIPREPVSVNLGSIMIDIDGAPTAVGTTRISVGEDREATFADGVYRLPAGDHVVEMAFYQEVLDVLGPDAEQIVTSAIIEGVGRGQMVLEVDEPFRWATDEEVPVQMGVVFDTFEVRRGCGDLAVACNATRVVQVIPLDRLYAPAPSWTGDPIYIESDAPRPRSDSYYVPPGPLSARYWPSVLWTGKEMIVWGGAERGDRPYLTDGAAFDPATGEWRVVAASPVRQGSTNRAVWAGDRMVVVGSEITAAYDPATDAWSDIGEGIEPSWPPDHVASAGGRVYAWTDAIYGFERETGSWQPLPELPFPVGGEPWMRSLRVVGDLLVAVGSHPGCDAVEAAVWSSGEWVQIGGAPASACVARFSASVGDGLLLWNDGSPSRSNGPKGSKGVGITMGPTGWEAPSAPGEG